MSERDPERNPQLFWAKEYKALGGTMYGSEITLRDLFAAFALDRVGVVSADGWEAVWAEIARQAYGMADAMLAEREDAEDG